MTGRAESNQQRVAIARDVGAHLQLQLMVYCTLYNVLYTCTNTAHCKLLTVLVREKQQAAIHS